MANKYGEAALIAARASAAYGKSPNDQWADAMQTLYRTSPAAQQKGGPRGAFLGLCDEGLITGIMPGAYSKSAQHKKYAVDAVTHLRAADCPATVTALWSKVAGDQPHSGQMDVVLALWKNNLIAK